MSSSVRKQHGVYIDDTELLARIEELLFENKKAVYGCCEECGVVTEAEGLAGQLDEAILIMVVHGIDARWVDGVGWTVSQSLSHSIPAGAKDRIYAMLTHQEVLK